MDQNQTDRHLTKNKSSKCEFHVTQTPKYYCPDLECRTHLCTLCMKQHPKEHLPNITTIEDVKSQTLDLLKKETLSRFDKFLNDFLKSREMDDLFKEIFGNLMQQNTTMNLDDEDIADILADTLQKKYFEKGIVVSKRIQEDLSVNFTNAELIAFDYEFDGGADENHDKHVQEFCQFSSEYYCREELESFYVESKGQMIFWHLKDQILLCKDIINSNKKSKKYKIPLAFQFLTVLESEGELLFVVASNDKLIVYLPKEENDLEIDPLDSENYSPLKMCKEFPLEEKLIFLASDHINHLFVMTERQSGLKANIYGLKGQNNELELLRIISFELFGLPKKVVFDRVNNLLFILSGEILKIFKYSVALAVSLQIITKIKTIDFTWHQTTKKLLLVDSKKLYQFDKGKFRLLRAITGSKINPIGLTSQGVFYNDKETSGLFLLSQKNPNQQKSFVLPLVSDEMGRLQDQSMKRFYEYDGETDPEYGKLQMTCNAVEILAETPDHLLIYANIIYYEYASQRLEYDSWGDYGGTLYTQYLLKYDLSQKEYKILEEDDKKPNN